MSDIDVDKISPDENGYGLSIAKDEIFYIEVIAE